MRIAQAWGLLNVKVTTTLDPDFTPFYQSRFRLQQTDGWVVANAATTSCEQFAAHTTQSRARCCVALHTIVHCFHAGLPWLSAVPNSHTYLFHGHVCLK